MFHLVNPSARLRFAVTLFTCLCHVAGSMHMNPNICGSVHLIQVCVFDVIFR